LSRRKSAAGCLRKTSVYSLPCEIHYFDPPWTPVFLRRNEVMLRIAP
jgi:hypothetical protein